MLQEELGQIIGKVYNLADLSIELVGDGYTVQSLKKQTALGALLSVDLRSEGLLAYGCPYAPKHEVMLGDAGMQA